MKLDRYDAGKILDAVDTVCLNCVEDTLDHPEVCESCPVRKMCNSIEYDEDYYDQD